jgi:multidrug efflux pump subunit AcrB
MTLGGVAAAIGLVIDDAIVVVENIYTHISSGQSRREAVQAAVSEITVPIIGSTITPVVVFLPLTILTGVTGVFFRSLALTMSVALLTSLVLALAFTPVLAERFVKARRRNAPVQEPLMKRKKSSPRKSWKRKPNPAAFCTQSSRAMNGFCRRRSTIVGSWLQ